MKRKLLFISCLLAFVFIACERDKNEDSLLLVDLDWADVNDQEIAVKDVSFWVFTPNGDLVKEHYYTAGVESALDLSMIGVGEYKVLTVTNLEAPFSANQSIANGGVIFKLDEPSASPAHAYFGISSFSLLNKKNSNITISQRRILSELNIEVEDAPQGTVLAAYVTNAADGILPMEKDDEGNFGRATSGNKNIVTIPEATTTNGTISTQTMRLMPTVAEATRANSGNSSLRFIFTHADGSTIQCDAQAPMMRSSGKYNLKMKYSELKPYMLIEPIKIDNWEEGWTVSGEIFNPTN